MDATHVDTMHVVHSSMGDIMETSDVTIAVVSEYDYQSIVVTTATYKQQPEHGSTMGINTSAMKEIKGRNLGEEMSRYNKSKQEATIPAGTGTEARKSWITYRQRL